MKKLIVVLAFVLLAGLSMRRIPVLQADTQSVFDGWNYTEIITSATIFEGNGRVGRLYGSSDTTPGANYFVLLDTSADNVSNAAWPISYPEGLRRSPALQFVVPSTDTVNGVWNPTTAQQYLMMDYGPYGVRIDSGAYVFKSAAASGQALRVGVLWRK